MRSRPVAEEGSGCCVRRAESAADRAILQRVERTLDALRHPGLVELVSSGPGVAGNWELRTRWVGPTVGHDQVRLSSSHVAGIGAAVATTLADLHALGWFHGAVSADHILIDRDGRPILCGLSSAGRLTDLSVAEADTAALTHVLEWLATRSGCEEDRSLRRALHGGRFRSGQAVVLARRLADPRLAPELPSGLDGPDPGSGLPLVSEADVAPGAPHAEPGVTIDQSPAQFTGGACSAATATPGVGPVGAAEAIAVAARASGWRGIALPGRWRAILRRAWGSPRLTAGVLTVGLLAGTLAVAPAVLGSQSAPACPAVDQGCRAVPTAGGVLATPTGHYKVGAPGDVVVLGRWGCGPIALPALLRPASGEVWIFDRWPTPSADVAARSLGRVPGARSLRVVAGRDGCDTLEAQRAGAAPVRMAVGPAR